jgi:hypothetical protein
MTRRGSTPVRRVQRGSNGRAVRSAETIERDVRAWALRVEHLTFKQIGDELGITKEGARQAVERHANTIPVEAVADVKQIVSEELDAMSRHLLQVIGRDHFRVTPSGRVVMHDGEPVLDHGPTIQAINAYIRIIQERAKILGLYAPPKRRVDVITHDALMDAVADLEADIARQEAELARHDCADADPDGADLD